MLKLQAIAAALVMALAVLTTSASDAEAQRRALQGGIIGGTAGAIIGGIAGRGAGGAIVGGVIGTAAGAIIGSQIPRSRRRYYVCRWERRPNGRPVEVCYRRRR